MNSLPGAAHTLYLDFTGYTEAQWGSYSNIVTPAFDQDGDPTTFNDAELAAMQKIWQYVAEDYAPFNINVSTVEPASFADGVALRSVIGGNGSWAGGVYGGLTYVGSFSNSLPNTSYVFPKNLGNGYPRYTANAVSHEAGHAFGLNHQSLYDSNGNLVQAYYTGPGNGTAPLMGSSYSAARSLWWYGTSTSATTYQDDMAVLSGPTNGFGYRPDDHGNTTASATPLVVAGNQLSGAGIVGTNSDADYFSFTTDTGLVTLSVNVPADIANLDSRLELRDASGAVIATAAPTTSLGATISINLSAGIYYAVVTGDGTCGDVGQYTITGSITAPSSTIAAPSGLAAAFATGQVNLRWTDNATNETGFRVERSTDGLTWVALATNLPAGSTSYTDSSVSAGVTYQYRVQAFNATQTSAYSNSAAVTLAPATPSGLTATPVSASSIKLAWQDVSGETGYKIERSLDGANWTQIAPDCGRRHELSGQRTSRAGPVFLPDLRHQCWRRFGRHRSGIRHDAASAGRSGGPVAPGRHGRFLPPDCPLLAGQLVQRDRVYY